MTRSEFKRQLKAQLLLRDWTFEDLANELGIRGQTIHSFFAGKSTSVRLAVRLCQAVDLPVEIAYRVCELPVPDKKKSRSRTSRDAAAKTVVV